MKKNYFPLIIVLLLCAALVVVSFFKENGENVSVFNDTTVNEETKNDTEKDNNKTNEETQKEEVFNQDDTNNKDKNVATQNSQEKKPNDEKAAQTTKSAQGLFLGMDDSNFVVIFMDDGSGTPKDNRFAIDRSLNFENSDVEIGDSVSFEYVTNSKDTKTIVKISRTK